jgi:acetolactate synthase-1/2/3 large subunit
MDTMTAQTTTTGNTKPAIRNVSGGQALMDGLIAEGVTTIFGYPGGAIMPIYDSIYDFSDQLNHILVRH